MSSDLDKLKEALSILTKYNSVEEVLEAAGLSTLPLAQRYGIIGGIITFTLTISAVIALLVFGGSFDRIVEQSENTAPILMDPVEARLKRALILEELLEKREIMMGEKAKRKKDHPCEKDHSKLACRLMNAPPPKKATDYLGKEFEANYIEAYRVCQDKPGGDILSGVPEARFEAYARSYAGCGVYTDKSYRRSYGRLYEAVTCKDHKTEKKFSRHYDERPCDIVGRLVRLEPIDVDRHAHVLHEITCGEAEGENRAYDPNEVWGFVEYGPFSSSSDLAASPIFDITQNEAVFAIVNHKTEKLLGIIMITNDDPKNLKIQLEHPIMKPVASGSAEQIEACFLLLDRIFALGYRRIQLSLDTQDAVGKKLPGRLGFTFEGVLLKDMIVKDANRDSIIYGMLNSDWKKGARTTLFTNLHGDKANKVDTAIIAKGEEFDEQQRVLREQKNMEGSKTESSSK